MYIKTDIFPKINIVSIKETSIVSLIIIKTYSTSKPISMELAPKYIDIRKSMLKDLSEIRITRSKG